MVAAMSGNAELQNMIELTNHRIRYVRWIAMREKVVITHAAHLHIFEAMVARDTDAADARMRDPIKTSNDEVTETVEKAFMQLYVPRH